MENLNQFMYGHDPKNIWEEAKKRAETAAAKTVAGMHCDEYFSQYVVRITCRGPELCADFVKFLKREHYGESCNLDDSYHYLECHEILSNDNPYQMRLCKCVQIECARAFSELLVDFYKIRAGVFPKRPGF